MLTGPSGPSAAVAQALTDFETAIALIGATLQHQKSAALHGAECELPGDFPVPFGVHKHTADGAVVGYGIKVASIPISNNVYVKAKLKEKADKLDANFMCVTGHLEEGHYFRTALSHAAQLPVAHRRLLCEAPLP